MRTKKEVLCKCGEFGEDHIRFYANYTAKCVRKETKAQHTPTPWKLGNGGMIYTKDLMTAIASTYGHEGNPIEEQAANAAYIVLAVNAYEKDQEIKRELLEACKALIGPTKHVPFMQAVEMAKQAIAKAEGK